MLDFFNNELESGHIVLFSDLGDQNEHPLRLGIVKEVDQAHQRLHVIEVFRARAAAMVFITRDVRIESAQQECVILPKSMLRESNSHHSAVLREHARFVA